MGNIKRKRSMHKTSVAVIETQPRVLEPCAKGHCHYWIIESPQGPTSIGICKFCSSIKEFDNYGPDFRWYGDAPDVLVPSLPDLTIDKGK